MNRLETRLQRLEAAAPAAFSHYRRVILREGEPEPIAADGEMLFVRRIIPSGKMA